MSKNNKVALIYGSDTGSTEYISEIIAEKLGLENLDFKDVVTMKPPDFAEYDIMIMGIPTWYIGELQTDWDDFFEEFKTIDFTGKTVAIFGLGDQLGYDEWFCDGVGILAKVVLDNGGRVIGYTDKDESYDFDTTPKSIIKDDVFYGLCIDEDNQGELTQDRLSKWVEQIKLEY